MQITNKEGLPQAWVAAARAEAKRYDRFGWMSVSDLINPPRIVQLTRRHPDELVLDASEIRDRILGTGLHHVLESAPDFNAIKECRIVVHVHGKDISMKADRIELIKPREWRIRDYKSHKAMAVILGSKPTETMQVNFYRIGYEALFGISITEGVLEVLIKDWIKENALRDPTYPQTPVVEMPVELWPQAEAANALRDRVELHAKCESLEDKALPLCSPAERWTRPPLWAVVNAEGKCLKNFGNEAEAHERMMALKKGGGRVEFRPGREVRCEDWCPVAHLCDYGRGIQAQKKEGGW